MSKETFYFQHDYNPTADPKIICLLGNYGGLGYGIFWRIVELLHQEEKHKLPLKTYIFEAIAKQMLTDAKQTEAIIKDCITMYELFESDGDFFWSNRVNTNIEKRAEISEIRSKAGKLGAKIKHSVAFAKQNVAKERKGKESKVNKNIYSEQSSLTPSQVMLNFVNNPNEQEKVISLLEERGITRENSSAEIKKFLNYWCELTKSGRQQRWQTERTFELRRRLATWFNNAQKFNKTNSNVIRSL